MILKGRRKLLTGSHLESAVLALGAYLVRFEDTYSKLPVPDRYNLDIAATAGLLNDEYQFVGVEQLDSFLRSVVAAYDFKKKFELKSMNRGAYRSWASDDANAESPLDSLKTLLEDELESISMNAPTVPAY